MLVFGELGEQQADELVADDEVVGLGDLGDLAIGVVVDLADDGVWVAEALFDVAQVQQRDQGAGVSVLGLIGVIGQHDDVLVGAGVESFQGGPVRGIAAGEPDGEILRNEVFARVGMGGGDVQHRSRVGECVQHADDFGGAIVPAHHKGARWCGELGYRGGDRLIDDRGWGLGQPDVQVVFGDSKTLITWVSGSLAVGVITMMDRAVAGLTSSTSAGLSGLPRRQTTRVFLVSLIRSRMAASMSTLSRSARIATHERRSLRLASTSSDTTTNTWSDQPSRTVWLRSMMRERPLRRSAIRASRPVVRTPIRALTMKFPPIVTASIDPRYRALPSSPPIVPGSRVRSRLRHTTPGQCPFSLASLGARTTAREATNTIIAADARPSQPISAGVPFDIVLSKAYRARFRHRA